MNLQRISYVFGTACVIFLGNIGHGAVGDSCQVVKLVDSELYPVLEGKYAKVPDLYCNKKGVYLQKTSGITPGYMYYVSSSSFVGWAVGSKWCRDPTQAYVKGEGDVNSPEQIADGNWQEKESDTPVTWTTNSTITVTCEYELGPWEIAGIILGITILAFIVVFVIVVCCCNCCDKKHKKEQKQQQEQTQKKAKAMTEKTALTTADAVAVSYHHDTAPPNLYTMPEGPYTQPAAAPPPGYTVAAVNQGPVPPGVYPTPQTTMPQPPATTPYDPYTGLKPKE